MKNLLHVLLQKLKGEKTPRIWVLNTKYCLDSQMKENRIQVRYSYIPLGTETPFSVDAIRDIALFNLPTFKKAYHDERGEILDSDTNDLRIMAIWSFYRNVQKGDILLYVYSNMIYGYYVISEDGVECVNGENECIHIRNAEAVKFPRPLMIEDRFGSPFFKLLEREYLLQIVRSIQG